MELAGTTLTGRYQLVRSLGEGGMATVFEALDLVLNRAVAVKVLHRQHSADPAFLARFWQEAQAAAGISHANVVSVYDFGEHAGTTFIVMELVKGRQLDELLATEGPLPPRRAAVIGAGICEALAAAHARGLVHRDVKPGNVMIGTGGEVKVMDFGLAHAADVQSGLTDPGTVMGSAHYISPEQAMGKQADVRSDLYATGVCLYELLTGARPFSGRSPAEIAIQHVNVEPAPLDQLRPGLPPALAAAVTRAMAKRPEARQQSAVELRRELELAADLPVTRAPAAAVVAHRPGVEPPTEEGQPPVTLTLPALPPGDDGHAARTPLPAGGRRRRLALAAAICLALLVGSAIAILPGRGSGGTPLRPGVAAGSPTTTATPTTAAPSTIPAEPVAGAPEGGGQVPDRPRRTNPEPRTEQKPEPKPDPEPEPSPKPKPKPKPKPGTPKPKPGEDPGGGDDGGGGDDEGDDGGEEGGEDARV